MSLIESTKKMDIPQVKELISQEDINLQDKYGCSALYYAAENGSKNIVDILVANGATIDAQNILGETALMRAIVRQHNDVARQLLQAGANPNIGDNDGYTGMHRAAFENDLDLTKLLEEKHGGDITAKTKSGSTILHCAAVGVTEVSENWDLIKWLLEQDIDQNSQDTNGVSVKDVLFQKDWSYVDAYEKITSSIVGDAGSESEISS